MVINHHISYRISDIDSILDIDILDSSYFISIRLYLSCYIFITTTYFKIKISSDKISNYNE